jgi:hypothetical protein
MRVRLTFATVGRTNLVRMAAARWASGTRISSLLAGGTFVPSSAATVAKELNRPVWAISPVYREDSTAQLVFPSHPKP